MLWGQGEVGAAPASLLTQRPASHAICARRSALAGADCVIGRLGKDRARSAERVHCVLPRPAPNPEALRHSSPIIRLFVSTRWRQFRASHGAGEHRRPAGSPRPRSASDQIRGDDQRSAEPLATAGGGCAAPVRSSSRTPREYGACGLEFRSARSERTPRHAPANTELPAHAPPRFPRPLQRGVWRRRLPESDRVRADDADSPRCARQCGHSP